MMKRIRIPQEAIYLVGLVLMAFSVALTAKADLGLSMVVAPAYVLATRIGISFGRAEYLLQALLLLFMSLLLRRFRLSYLFSFLTAFLYGLVLDFFVLLLAGLPAGTLPLRIVWFVAGMILTAFAVALMFRAYLSPQAYDLFVREVSSAFFCPIDRFKFGYDSVSALLSLILSFSFFGFGNFVGIGWGTLIAALCNGFIIGFFGRFLDRRFEFYPALPPLFRLFPSDALPGENVAPASGEKNDVDHV